MDVIREHLMYKNNFLEIQMNSLKPQEQYEVIRLLLATRTKDVVVKIDSSVNKYVHNLLEKIGVTILCADA
jgi:hypothetical protein